MRRRYLLAIRASHASVAIFEDDDLASDHNRRDWAPKWDVTEAQIRIASLRAGSRPADVLAEISGRDGSREIAG